MPEAAESGSDSSSGVDAVRPTGIATVLDESARAAERRSIARRASIALIGCCRSFYSVDLPREGGMSTTHTRHREGHPVCPSPPGA